MECFKESKGINCKKYYRQRKIGEIREEKKNASTREGQPSQAIFLFQIVVAENVTKTQHEFKGSLCQDIPSEVSSFFV